MMKKAFISLDRITEKNITAFTYIYYINPNQAGYSKNLIKLFNADVLVQEILTHTQVFDPMTKY